LEAVEYLKQQGLDSSLSEAMRAADPLFAQQDKMMASDGAANDRFGSSIAIDGNTAVIGSANGGASERGSAYVFVRAGGSWSQQAKLIAPDRTANQQFGASVAIDADTVVVGAPNAIAGSDRDQDAAYVFVRSGATWSEQQKLTASDGAVGDQFGASVAIDADTIVVGAQGGDTTVNANQGVAYVFERSGGTWSEQQKLAASDRAADDQFGASIAVSSGSIVVGAPGGNRSKGAAYVFVRGGGTWTEQQKLTASDGGALDYFGLSVAISGDKLVIGAFGADIGANSFQGAAYVFERGSGIWFEQQKLTALDGAANRYFGFSVTIEADTVVVGAPGAGGLKGAAYIFTRGDRSWAEQKKLTALNGTTNDQFGSSVGVSANTMMIGARRSDIGLNADQGSAYAFVKCGQLSQRQKLTALNGATGDFFGYSVAVFADTMVIGGIFANGGKGAAYVFSRSGGVWTERQNFTDPDGALNNQFGVSVAISADTMVIGELSASGEGAAHIFARSGGAWIARQKLTAPGRAARDQFGASVAISADTIVIGSLGAAYVFARSGAIWIEQQKLIANDVAASARFGSSIALSGDSIVVGSPVETFGENSHQGSAYVFVRRGENWMLQQKLYANDGKAFDRFGYSVAVSDDTVVVGASIDLNSQGKVYIFARSGGTWTQRQKLVASDGSARDQFGASAAVSADAIVIGAPGSNLGRSAAYVFARNSGTWVERQKLTASDGAMHGSFGASVAMYGDTTVIGARSNSSNSTQGAAYLYDCNGCATIELDPVALPGGVLGNLYNQNLSAGGGSAPYQFSLSSGSLPPGLTLSQSGLLSGVPSTRGSYGFTITATAADRCPGIRVYTLTITYPCSRIELNPTLPVGTVGQPYNHTITVEGATSPYRFLMPRNTLPGLNLSPDGTLSGVPYNFGEFECLVRVTDANGCTGSRTYTVIINPPCQEIIVDPPALLAGTAGSAYYGTLTARGGAVPHSFTLASGALPSGLSLSPQGVLSGVPIVDGAFNFEVTAMDARGCKGSRTYSLTINDGIIAAASQYYPLPSPIRLLDTQPGAAACFAPGAPLGDDELRTQQTVGPCSGIPADARAIVGNATIVNFISKGSHRITLYSSEVAHPGNWTLNFTDDQILSNQFTLGLGPDGSFKIHSDAATHFIVEITGYYAPPGAAGLYYHPLPAPVRLFDSRPAAVACDAPGEPLAGGDQRTVLAHGSCLGVTIPSSARSVVGNVTAVNSISSEFHRITLFPFGAPLPDGSTLNFTGNQPISNAFVVGLSKVGSFNIYSDGATDALVDVTGYFSDEPMDLNGKGLLYYSLPEPVRLLDTQPGAKACDAPGAPLGDDATLTQTAGGLCGSVLIPSRAKAVLGNATVVNFFSKGSHWITLYRYGASQPDAPLLHFTQNQIVSNAFAAGLSPDGKFNIYSSASTHFIIDLTGYFAP
jgi:hypothetical protein